MRPGLRVSRFTARFDSDCDTFDVKACSGEIYEGDEAGYIGEDADGASCEACCDVAEQP